MTATVHNLSVVATTRADARVGRFSEKSANRKEHKALGTEASFGPAATAIAQVAPKVWPEKTAAELALAAGVSTRRAEQWLAGRAGISGDAVLSILHSEKGQHFLRAMMAAAKTPPKYWTRIEKQLEISDLRERLAKLERGEEG